VDYRKFTGRYSGKTDCRRVNATVLGLWMRSANPINAYRRESFGGREGQVDQTRPALDIPS
jgi:hypothetical protein